MMLAMVIAVMDVEVDNVADKVADMVVKVPDEDFSYMTLANGDIYGYDVKFGEQ